MTLSRRSFITGLISFAVTAPAIVKASSLMPVKQMLSDMPAVMFQYGTSKSLYDELADVTRRAFVPRLYVQIYRVDPVYEMLYGR